MKHQQVNKSLPSYFMQHIKILNDAGLVQMDEQGRNRFCYANLKPLKEVNKWMQFYSQFWDDSLDSLEGFLDGKKV